MKLLPLILSLILVSMPAAAQQVWRCGPDGRLFSDRPCADGHVFASADRRSAEEVDAARELASRELKLADSLATERRQRASIPPGAGLMAIGPTEAELRAERQAREIKRQRSSKRQPTHHRRLQSGAGI